MRNRPRWLLAFAVAVWLLAVPASMLLAQRFQFDVTDERLELLSPSMQREIAGLQYLLNAYQLRQFFSLPSEAAQREWIERWWRSRDPTPATAVNEMRVEHDRRVETARLAFGWREWPGWDHRGEVFIRYGDPEFRYDIDWDVTPAGAAPPGKAWQYHRHNMMVVFEDRTLNGRYTYAFHTRGNLDTRRITGGGDIYGPHGNTAKPIDADFDGPRGYPIVPPTNWYYVHLSDEQRERINNFEAVLRQYPSTYPFNFDRNEMPFYYGVGQFKGGESVNRVEVDVEFQAAPVPPLLVDEVQKFHITAVFFDNDFNEIDRLRQAISLPAAAVDGHDELWYPAQLVCTLPEAYYRVAVTVEETGSGRQSSYRSTVVAGDFRYDTAISDVLFCSRISPAAGESPFNRGALEVIPHPRADYRAAATVPVYFELYNLEVDRDGLSSYAVEYWIVPAGRRSGSGDAFAVSRFESSDYGADATVNVSLETEHLTAGEHVFHVRVTDLNTRFVTERAASFRIVE